MSKIKKVIFWMCLAIMVLSTILVKPLLDLDEIWNFNVARSIANGLLPYKDVTTIVTPLLSFIVAGILKIFGSELIVTRILAAILAMVNLSLIYKILKKAKVNELVAHATVLLVAIVFKDYFCLDYNFFVVTLGLIVMLLEIKYFDSNKKRHQIIIGILGGLAICTKQTIGILICSVIIVNKFYFIKNKSDFKNVCKKCLYRIIGISIPIVIFVIYLLVTRSVESFMDYCVWGISTFNNKKPYFDLIKGKKVVAGFAIAVPIIIAISIVENIWFKIKKNEKSNFYTLTFYCLPILLIVYPIADEIHMLIASIPTIILFGYVVNQLIKIILPKIKVKMHKYIVEFASIAITLAVVFLTGYVEIKNTDALSDLSKYKEINHFKYIIIDKSIRNTIKDVDEYILSQDKEVYVLDSRSAVYRIPIDKYTKDFDVFLVGNLGAGGEEKQIERIKNTDAKYLILSKTNGLNWQTPLKVREYVLENMEKVDSVNAFDVYENKAKETTEENSNDGQKDEEQSKEENNEKNAEADQIEN